MDTTCWNLTPDRRWGVFFLEDEGWVEYGYIHSGIPGVEATPERTGLVLPRDFTFGNERTRWHLEHMLRPMRKMYWDKKNRRLWTDEEKREQETRTEEWRTTVLPRILERVA